MKFLLETSFSFILTSPSTGSYNPAIILNKVVLPMQEAPIIDAISPSFSEKLKSLIVKISLS